MPQQPVVVSQAYLDGLNRSLTEMGISQQQLGLAVQQVRSEQESSRSRLEELNQKFTAFMEADRLAKNMQLAQSRLNTVRQELRTDYGHYAEVRRHATGILQGMDVGLIPHGTIRQATEELMLATPRYWLAPALVALAAWIRDDRPLAERGLREALRRDNDKTSLFFALVLRRSERNDAAVRWLRQYLGRQDAGHLGQEFAVLLDAVAIGGFGPTAKKLILEHSNAWYERLIVDTDAVDAQVARWRDFIDSHRQPVPGSVTVLPQLSPSWPALREAYERASVFTPVLAALRAVYDRPLSSSQDLPERMDEVLTRLVSSFDIEEAPLRKKESELLAVIDSGGDAAAAHLHSESVKAVFESRIDFMDLLTNAAILPRETGVSNATQRLATTLCRDWTDQAAGRLEAASLAAVPKQVEIAIEGWKCAVKPDTPERDVVDDLRRHNENRRQRDIAAVGTDLPIWIARVAGALAAAGAIVVLVVGTPLFAAALLICAGAAFGFGEYERITRNRRREAIEAMSAQRAAEQERQLHSALAELVDFHQQTAEARAHAAELHEFLQGLRSETHIAPAPDTVREVIT